MPTTRVLHVSACLMLGALLLHSRNSAGADEFRSAAPENITRAWTGPDYYADRLQDWRLRDGRFECVEAAEDKPLRVLHLITADARTEPGELRMNVRLGAIEKGAPTADALAGFLIGAGGPHVDYRLTALVHHRPAEDGGLIAVINGHGHVSIRDNERTSDAGELWGIGGKLHPDELKELPAASKSGDGFANGEAPDEIELRLNATPTGDTYRVELSAYYPLVNRMISSASVENVDPHLINGGLGLVSSRGPAGGKRGHWFRDWHITGSKLTLHPERHFGPVICTQYTLNRGILKMTAQLPPLGEQDIKTAQLQIRKADSADWETIATGEWVDDSFTVPFHVENWDASRNVPYRVTYDLKVAGGKTRTCEWSGTIRAEPVNKAELVIAAFTGTKHFTGGLRWNHMGIWFPHNELVAAVQFHRPDLLFFSGDQIYEGDLTGAQHNPLDKALLDYLDKWYRWCWAFRDLARERPCVCIPDDHDVYHGNLWGAGGRHAEQQDDGGYRMPPRFVKMVERTQTSHLPDPYDPTPVEQGIGVYYTSMNYAGVSFAIIEDRKFKDSATPLVPEGQVVNGWFQNPNFDPAAQADVPGAKLLGKRQLVFLRDWAANWSGNTWMKIVLSQTIFANVATLPSQAVSDDVVPQMRIPTSNEYPPDDRRAADCDSNGWPQTGRNQALREIRRGFAFHIAGDQHLGSLTHYGVDEWDDAGYAFCVPSIANTWPRRWCPPQPGRNHQDDMPRYTGQYLDGFGNRITVLAVSNPTDVGVEPARLYNRAPGYGIIRCNRHTRDITVECWPRWVDPSRPDAKQYAGWPITVNQLDNYGREAKAHLPMIEVKGLTDPVVQVIDESNDEVVYTLRINGTSFRPKVFKDGTYTLKVGDPDAGIMKTLKGVQPENKTIELNF